MLLILNEFINFMMLFLYFQVFFQFCDDARIMDLSFINEGGDN